MAKTNKLFSIRSFLESKYYLIFGFIFSWILVTIAGIQAIKLESSFANQLTLTSDLAWILGICFFGFSLIFFIFYYLAFFLFVHTKRIDFKVIKKSFWLITITVFLTIIVDIIVILVLKDVISIGGINIANILIKEQRDTFFWTFIILFPLTVIFAFVGISISTKMFLQWQDELKNKYQKPTNIQK